MISIVIPSYNSENTIAACLCALKGQSYQGPYEIILVDSSTDKTPRIVTDDYPDIRFTHLDRKTDPGTARNIGVRIAKGELIAFIDSDCVAAHDWLERIADSHLSGYDVVGGGVCFGNSGSDPVAWAGYMAEFREFLPCGPSREVLHIPTCNISYKKRIFDKYGPFNGKYYPQEDLVYNYNLHKQGERILFNPEILVYHRHRSKMIDFLKHQRRIGKITSRVLKQIDLEGAFVVRKPYWGGLFVPLLPLVKFFRTINAFLRGCPGAMTKHPLVLLCFWIGLLFWVWGFGQGLYGKKLT